MSNELWAVHAQGPDDIYPAYDRADAERHAAELNALPTPPGISVAAVVIPSPFAELEHWKGVAELEREHKLHLMPLVAPTDANLSAMRKEGLSIDGDNAYKRDLLDCVVGALAFGKQRQTPPPAGHWLERFYQIGQAEADERDQLRARVAELEAKLAAPSFYWHDDENGAVESPEEWAEMQYGMTGEAFDSATLRCAIELPEREYDSIEFDAEGNCISIRYVGEVARLNPPQANSQEQTP